jgi:integrase
MKSWCWFVKRMSWVSFVLDVLHTKSDLVPLTGLDPMLMSAQSKPASEILNLQWCNVDLFRRTITLLEQRNGGRDTLPVNAKTLNVLKARAKFRSLKTDYVF